jgi:hypothetical protein
VRRTLAVWIPCLLTVAVVRQAPAAESTTTARAPATTRAHRDSFARYVPADVRAYGEIYDLARLESKLIPDGWSEWTRFAAGQTSQPAVTVEWGERVGRILGMSLADATKNLFGRQAALAAPSYDELAEGVVLARAPSGDFIADLLKKNQATQQPPIGGVPCYLLREGLSLAVKDTVVILGGRGRKSRLFERSVELLGGQKAPALIDAPSFGQQASSLLDRGAGVVYLDLPADDGGASNPPGTGVKQTRSQSFWSTFRRLVVGIEERGQGLDLEVQGLLELPVVRGGLKDVSLEAVGGLPESTLLVWAQTMDLAENYRQIMASRGPEQRSLRFNLEVIKALLEPIDLEKDFLEKLGPQVMLVCGHEPASDAKTGGSYDMPLVAVMVESRDVEATSAVLHRLAERFLGWMKVQFARAKRTLDLNVVETTYKNTTIYRIRLESLFAQTSLCPYLQTLELCWGGVDGWLVIATHPDYIRQIIDARRLDPGRRFAGTSAFEAVRGRTDVSSLILARPIEAGRMLQSWIDYSSKVSPHVFKPLWWERMMVRRAGRRVELGIIIKEGAEPGRVVVGNPVLPEMPAAGRLKPNDKICAVDGRALSEDRPEDDLRDFIAMRRGPSVVLRIERDGKLLDVRIPLSPPPPLPIAADIDPVGSIRYLIGLTRGVSAAGFVRGHAQPHEFRAALILRMQNATRR